MRALGSSPQTSLTACALAIAGFLAAPATMAQQSAAQQNAAAQGGAPRGSSPLRTGFDPDELYVDSITHEGRACQGGSLTFNVAPDASHLTLFLGDFRVDGGHTATCKVELQLHVPTGWSFEPIGAEISGFARLGNDVTASQSLSVVRNAAPPVPLATHTWKGPLTSDYRIAGPTTPGLWHPCAGKPANDGVVKLTLMSETKVDGLPGTLRGVSLDGELRERVRLAWRRCDPRTGEALQGQALKGKH